MSCEKGQIEEKLKNAWNLLLIVMLSKFEKQIQLKMGAKAQLSGLTAEVFFFTSLNSHRSFVKLKTYLSISGFLSRNRICNK